MSINKNNKSTQMKINQIATVMGSEMELPTKTNDLKIIGINSLLNSELK